MKFCASPVRGGFRRSRCRCIAYGQVLRFVNAVTFILALSVNLTLPGAAAAQAADPIRLVAIGDSLTAGFGLARADSFPQVLQGALRAEGLNVTVINAGVSGDTSAGGLARLDWVLAEGADAVIVELGANDGLRGLNPSATRSNLDAILMHLGKRGIPALLTGMLAPPNLGRDYGSEFREVYGRMAEKNGVALYPFFLEGVAAKAELNQPDGIHPNPQGVRVIVSRILPHVKDLLRSLK
jgi:acyl-CoA thioesterase I